MSARRPPTLGLALAGATATTAAVIWGEMRLAHRNAHVPPAWATSGRDGIGEGDDPLRICWLGDSLAAGCGAFSRETTLPGLVAALLNRPVVHEIRAVPGSDVTDVAASQVPAPIHADVIVHVAGANDVGHLTTDRRFRAALDATLDAVAPTPTVVASIPAIGVARRIKQPLRGVAAARGAQLNRSLRAVVASHPHARYCDIRTRPDWVRARDAHRYLSVDKFHPSAAGYAVWSLAVSDAVNAIAPR